MNLATLSSLIPIAFFLHCTEEWFGGFPAWATRRFGPITTKRFYLLSHVPLFAVVVSVAEIGRRLPHAKHAVLLMVALQSVLVTNGVFHVISAIKFKEYSPGLVTSVFLYLPLSFLIFGNVISSDVIPTAHLLLAIGLGVGVSILIVRSL